MALELPSMQLHAPMADVHTAAELPANETPTPARSSSISKKHIPSNYDGYSDGLSEYLTLYGGYTHAKRPPPVQIDPEKIAHIDDGLIPAHHEKAFEAASDLHFVEPAQGIEAIESSDIPQTKPADGPRECESSAPEVVPDTPVTYSSRPPTRSKNQTPQLTSLAENAELPAAAAHHVPNHYVPPPVPPIPDSPPHAGHDRAVAESLLEGLALDWSPPKSNSLSSSRSIKSVKSRSKFPLIPRRSFSRLFRRDSESKKSLYKPNTLAIGLQHAAHSGNINLVKTLVTLGAKALPVDDRPTRYRDALSCAAVDGHKHIVDYLIKEDCGVDQDAIDAAFIEACYASQVDMAMRLVRNYGASLETRKMAEWEKIVQDMPEEGKRHIVYDRSCYHALAIMPNSTDRDRLLNFLVSCDDFNKDQVVHHTFVVSRATHSRQSDSQNNKTYISQNQRVSVHCYKYTAISLFTSFGFISGVNLLLEYGIKTKYSEAEKITLASLSGPESVLPDFPAYATSTPDPISCISDHNHLHCPVVSAELMGVLLVNGADPHISEQTENDSSFAITPYTLNTPLFRAIAGRNIAAISILLNIGIQQSTDDHPACGRSLDVTPLGLAIETDDVEIVNRLLQSGWKSDYMVGWGPMKANGSRQVVGAVELARKSRKKRVLSFLKRFNNLDDDDEDEEINELTRETGYGLSGYSYYGV